MRHGEIFIDASQKQIVDSRILKFPKFSFNQAKPAHYLGKS